MIIAAEGPDLSGKTSLLDELQKHDPYSMWPRLRLQVSRHAVKDPNMIEAQAKAWNEAVTTYAKWSSALLDRAFVTSYIYSRLFGRKADLTYLFKISDLMDPVIVYIKTPAEILMNRLKERGDWLISDANRLVTLSSIYDDWAENNIFNSRLLVVDGSLQLKEIVDVLKPLLENADSPEVWNQSKGKRTLYMNRLALL